jgi:NADH-quinone oxidoreductase subunit N
MISLAYYLRVIAAMWMRPAPDTALVPSAVGPGGRPALAGGAATDPLEPTVATAERTRAAEPEVVFVAVLFGIATLAGGIVPSPLFDLVKHAGRALTGLF